MASVTFTRLLPEPTLFKVFVEKSVLLILVTDALVPELPLRGIITPFTMQPLQFLRRWPLALFRPALMTHVTPRFLKIRGERTLFPLKTVNLPYALCLPPNMTASIAPTTTSNPPRNVVAIALLVF